MMANAATRAGVGVDDRTPPLTRERPGDRAPLDADRAASGGVRQAGVDIHARRPHPRTPLQRQRLGRTRHDTWEVRAQATGRLERVP